MKKTSKNIIGKSFVEKAVALAIVAVFIGSAFVPAVGSQVGSITNEMSSEDKDINIGTEESIDNLVSDNSKDPKSGESLWDRFTYIINGILDFLGDNPIVNRLRELFTGKNVNSDTNDYDTSPIEGDQLAAKNKIDMLDQNQDQPRDNPDPLPLDAGDPWWNTGWGYRKEIVIDHEMVDASLTNFPVLISLPSDVDLRDDAQPDGDDIAFTDDGDNQLAHEIEYFDGGTGELVCWVNVTSVSSTINTTLYMYYGNLVCGNQENPSDVWDSDYLGVWHLNESSGTVYDSTSYDHDGSTQGGVTQGVSGMIDKAVSFDGVNGLVSGSAFSLPNEYTIELLFNCSESNGWRPMFEMGATGTTRVTFWLYQYEYGALAHKPSFPYVSSSDADLVDDVWYYGAETFKKDDSPEVNAWLNADLLTLSLN